MGHEFPTGRDAGRRGYGGGGGREESYGAERGGEADEEDPDII